MSLVPRGQINVKGKGYMFTFWVMAFDPSLSIAGRGSFRRSLSAEACPVDAEGLPASACALLRKQRLAPCEAEPRDAETHVAHGRLQGANV